MTRRAPVLLALRRPQRRCELEKKGQRGEGPGRALLGAGRGRERRGTGARGRYRRGRGRPLRGALPPVRASGPAADARLLAGGWCLVEGSGAGLGSVERKALKARGVVACRGASWLGSPFLTFSSRRTASLLLLPWL